MLLTHQIPLIIIFIVGINTLTENKEIDFSRNHTLFQNITRLENIINNTRNTNDTITKITDESEKNSYNFIFYLIAAFVFFIICYGVATDK